MNAISDVVTGADLGGRVQRELKVGEKFSFMWMPAGQHKIVAGFRNGSIELNVICDKSTADKVNASLQSWREERPKQEPFGCVEHREQEASFRVNASCNFSFNDDGVYLTAVPTKLGAENINGGIHRSWSPSFTTDADYSAAKTIQTSSGQSVLVFPEGVRGSSTNPATITGVDFCLGTITNRPAFHAMAPVKARETVQATGTSEGVRKSWESRRTGSGKAIPHVSDDVYTRSEKVPKWNVPVSPLRDRDVGGRQLKQRLPEFSKADHEHAAKAHMEAASEHEKAWGETQDKAHKETFGKKPEFHDYRVSGVGRDEYSEEHKDALRHHALSKTDHMSAAHAHWKAAGHHGVTTEELKSKVSASEAITAHCHENLLRDVPDATKAEIAQYEKLIDDGGAHGDAVYEIRKDRKNGFVSTAEKPTLDSIYGKVEASQSAANQLAEANGMAKLTAEDVYARHTVTAVWSDAARKAALEARKRKKGAAYNPDSRWSTSMQSKEETAKMSEADIKEAIHDTHTYLKEELGKAPTHGEIATEFHQTHGVKLSHEAIKKHLKTKASEMASGDAVTAAAPTLESIYARAGENR